MYNNKAVKFYATFWVALIGAILVCLYISTKYVSFHMELAEQHSGHLSEFTYRSFSRIAGSQDTHLLHSGTEFGNKKMLLTDDYQRLLQLVPSFPADQSLFTLNRINIVFEGINGLFSIADFALVLPSEFEGRRYYSVFRFNTEFNDENLEVQLAQSLQPVVFTAASLFALLFLIQFIHTYKMDSNLQKLANWAQDLSVSNTPSAPPQMLDKGLTPLATMLNNSLATFNQVLEQEHSFAKFTSHELRTQVAILSVNMEILDTIMADLKPSERKVLYRMEQVVSDMKYQTEALLWVSKEVEHELEYSTCDLLAMVKKSVDDSQYLLGEKAVSIEIVGKERSVNSHFTLLQIALNNLIRNAVQNTNRGSIIIQIDVNGMSILNQDEEPSASENSRGFGIGLVMVEKICQKLSIDYQANVLTKGRLVKLKL